MARVRIVVVAGDTGRRLQMARALQEAGWLDVESAESAAEAVLIIRRGPTGCAVVDAQLADVSGVQGIPILRAADPQLKIIFAAPGESAELESRVRTQDVFYYHLTTDGTGDLVAAVEAAVGHPRPGVASGQAQVLVVDDDPCFRGTVKLLLEHEGCRVTTASNGAEALAAARSARPDLVVLDIMMESATAGLQLVHELRGDRQLRHTPLVAVSSVSRRSGLISALSSGDELSRTDGYFEKPLDPHEFVSAVRRLLGKGG
jgi:CheY-like chemotaxis protein